MNVENPPLAPEPVLFTRRGSNQHYETVELSPLGCRVNDNELDQYATPLDMERDFGEYEMPLASNVKQNDKDASRKPRKCPNGKSSQEIQEKEEAPGLYCNSDHLPARDQHRHFNETEQTSVTANNTGVALPVSSTQ